MAIKFNTTGLKTVQSNSYSLNSFNGVDMTTTPVSVDDTRAIEMSNYIPYGNALVKRNGLTRVTALGNVTDDIIHIAKFNGYYIIFLIEGTNLVVIKTTSISPSGTEIIEFRTDISSKTALVSSIEYDEHLFVMISISSIALSSHNLIYATLDKSFNVQFIYNNGNRSVSISSTTYTMQPYTPTYAITSLANESEDISGQTQILEPINLLGWYNYSTNLKANEIIIKATGTVSPTKDANGYINLKVDLSFLNTLNCDIDIISSYPYSKITYIDDQVKTDLGISTTLSSIASINNSMIYLVQIPTTSGSTTTVEQMYIEVQIMVKIVTRTGETYSNILVDDFTRFILSMNKSVNRLFWYGNSTKPNIDVHTGYASYSTERWRDFAYIPDDSYQIFGSSNSAILGYGILSNGVQAIFTESYPNQPNLYFRTPTITTGTDDYGNPTAVETYPIQESGISLDIKGFDQIIQFGNDLLVNVPSGIYRVAVGTSTATQTYLTEEVSYFIRNDLAEDLTGFWHLVYKNKLYICRKNKQGHKRVYVADINRQVSVNGSVQYEWWVLDDFYADKPFLITNDELLFTKDYGIYQFNDKKYSLLTDTIGSTTYSNEIYIYTDYADKNIPVNLVININSIIYKDIIAKNNKDDIIALKKNLKIYTGQENATVGGYSYYNDEFIITEICTYYQPLEKFIRIEDCYYNGNTWYADLEGQTIEFVSGNANTEARFIFLQVMEKRETITNQGIENKYLDFVIAPNGYNTSRLYMKPYEVKIPVKSYWYSKYNHLNTIDTLKTATNIYFVPDPNKGGETKVGYRTSKRDSEYATKFKGYFTMNVSELDFNLIDFEDFSFGQMTFGRTYSSKKKIKNFSFIQIKFFSEEPTESSISLLSFKYRYTKNNKGVK